MMLPSLATGDSEEERRRFPVLQPIPQAISMLYRIQQSCVVRGGVELFNDQVRILSSNGSGHDRSDNDDSDSAYVSVLSRIYSDFPTQNCIQRLRLAPGAFASQQLNVSAPERVFTRHGNTTTASPQEDESTVLKSTGKIDESFDPSSPGLYHFRNYCQWRPYVDQELLTQTDADMNANSLPNAAQLQRSAENLLDTNNPEEDELLSLDGTSSLSSLSSPAPPSSDNHQNNDYHVMQKLCMCCEDQVANATLVHGQTGHICCCWDCACICQAEGLGCPICRLPIDQVIMHFFS